MPEPNSSPTPGDWEDRICAVFGLPGGDPLPHRNDASDQTYYDYLKAHLCFPFAARFVDESIPSREGRVGAVTVLEMAEELPTDDCYGAMCQVRDGDCLREVPLTELNIEEEGLNQQIIEDYTQWLYSAEADAAEDEDFEEEFDEEEDFGEDEDLDEEQGHSAIPWDKLDLAGRAGPPPPPPPPKLERPQRAGRNAPCPCGSGKKFKKCCLKNQPAEPPSPLEELLGPRAALPVLPPPRPAAPALTDTAYQIKVTLLHSQPSIWRRFRVNDCDLATLHGVLQTVMGWHDEHLHCFEVGGNRYGDMDRSSFGSSMKDEMLTTLGRIAQRGLTEFVYEYDFGDSWRHQVLIEQTLPEADAYPECLEGQRACPPEDSGGVGGYEWKLEVLQNPAHREYEEIREWMGDFDPEKFSLDDVNRRLAWMRKNVPDE